MENARLDEAQAGNKIARRDIITSHSEYTTLMAENKEELKSLLMKVKDESEKAGLKLTPFPFRRSSSIVNPLIMYSFNR